MSKFSRSRNDLDFETEDTYQSVIDWISTNKKVLINVLLVLMTLLIALYFLISNRNTQAEANFIKAQTLFDQFQAQAFKDPAAAHSQLMELKDLLNQYPDLRSKYDGAIAQTLLIADEGVEAEPFANSIFKRTASDHLQVYEDFSKSSLLISQKHYEKALEQTHALQQKLNAQTFPILYAFNLVRLASLQQEMKQTGEEVQTWQILEKYLANAKNKEELLKALSVGKTPFSDYIAQRKTSINR